MLTYSKVKLPRIQILLSTFNGEKYISEQINSILGQRGVEVNLLIRDDGSTDNTVRILKKFEEKDSRINVYYGSNVGVVNSYFDLLYKANSNNDYYAFSDQDDVWKPNKLIYAVEKLNGIKMNTPNLYCGSTQLVDEQLHYIKGKKHYRERIVPSFENAMIENIACGCTMVFNKKLLEIIINNKKPQKAIMHDWWIYLVASALGNVTVDEVPYILYRQHNNNVVGNPQNRKELIKRRIFNQKKKIDMCEQLIEFSNIYPIKKQLKEEINVIVGKKSLKKIKLFLLKKIYRQKKIDNLLYSVYILTWRYK